MWKHTTYSLYLLFTSLHLKRTSRLVFREGSTPDSIDLIMMREVINTDKHKITRLSRAGTGILRCSEMLFVVMGEVSHGSCDGPKIVVNKSQSFSSG